MFSASTPWACCLLNLRASEQRLTDVLQLSWALCFDNPPPPHIRQMLVLKFEHFLLGNVDSFIVTWDGNIFFFCLSFKNTLMSSAWCIL